MVFRSCDQIAKIEKITEAIESRPSSLNKLFVFRDCQIEKGFQRRTDGGQFSVKLSGCFDLHIASLVLRGKSLTCRTKAKHENEKGVKKERFRLIGWICFNCEAMRTASAKTMGKNCLALWVANWRAPGERDGRTAILTFGRLSGFFGA
jgi:hypothetical protein